MATSQEWLTSPLRWTNDHKSILLSDKNSTKSVPDLTLSEIMQRSMDFPKKIPVASVCCSNLKRKKSKKILEKNINSAYPVIHEHSLYLCSKFLAFQTKFGNKFYQNMSLVGLIDRLLGKRAVTFIDACDRYILLNGKEGRGNWESIGTPNEKPPLVLKDCLSYDEIKLSALLSVSSPTYFINDGNRTNCGFVEENLEKIEETGVIVGLIGTRLEKEKVMEYREIMKTPRQNTVENGYGNKTPTLQETFLEFYGDTNGTYLELLEQLKSSDRYIDLGEGNYFDKLMFERRIALSIDTLLIEANDRAKKEGRIAYIHVVGTGLGVWKICSNQNAIFMDTFAKRLEFLQNHLGNVSDVCFAYIRHNMVGPYKNGDQLGQIKIHIKNRNPHDKLKGVDHGKLLVVSYAWDGNALPGNEFWFGSLAGSGDPAAASSTQVAELHNYHINGKVCGANLRVATLCNGLVTFTEYQELHRDV